MKVRGAFTVLQPVFQDTRGVFESWWDQTDVNDLPFVFQPQSACHSYNINENTLRGIHFQYPPYERSLIVSCVSGKSLDVVVDLRPDSPTYLVWDAVYLSAESGQSVFIPKGCAHGFLTLQDKTTVAYLIEGAYQPHAAGVLRWNDPSIDIDWPCLNPILSEKDRNAPNLKL